jgi:hypothetical protein
MLKYPHIKQLSKIVLYLRWSYVGIQNRTIEGKQNYYLKTCMCSHPSFFYNPARTEDPSQGDQMRLRKSRPKCRQILFLWKSIHNFCCGKKSAQLLVLHIYVIFTKTTQSKQSPIGRKFAQSGHPAPFSSINTFESFFPWINPSLTRLKQKPLKCLFM